MSETEQDKALPYKSDPARVRELRRLLLQSLARNTPCDCILLSGGVDTSILAEAAFAVYNINKAENEDDPTPKPLSGAVTVLCTDHATDEFYASQISARLGLTQKVVKITLDSVLEELEFCIRTLQTFDPMELRNGIVIARGLTVAKSLGYTTVMTGDGADELFAGYSFLHTMSAERLQAYSDKLTKIMRFSGVELAKALGLKLDRLSGRQLHGKFILREAFEEEAFSAWRKKEPIEVGSGTTVLPKMFQESMSAEDLKKEQDRILEQEGIKIRDVEHLQYFKAFKKVFGEDMTTYPEKLRKDGRDPCPGCGFNLSTPDQTFCVICGQWPARVLPPPEEIAKTTDNSE
ncbi:hypothetical protein BGZ70_008698 [Mortierella alpina]|uniref:Asparagine synthetase domain-containing protein n=1 Tax=Mortierella alpina TaxID=64518 RepID=A0A9P6J2Y3_MORAP|nr:hypothetical protein BGZ70_008698 [Mortierella alpina]